MLFRSFNQPFPECDESALAADTVNMALQINGKVKDNFDVPVDASREDIEKQVREQFADMLDGKDIKKFIVVPGRIVNIVM